MIGCRRSVSATRPKGLAGRMAGAMLAVACFVSILSGLFDGQITRSVTAVLGALGAITAAHANRNG
jgi:hypothetical protein